MSSLRYIAGILLLGLIWVTQDAHSRDLFTGEVFTKTDAVLVVDQSGETLFDWQSTKPLIPASLTKLATAHLAINKWGLGHRFVTEFYMHKQALWVKGYGDPYLISEELDLIAQRLAAQGVKSPSAIYIDNRYFDIDKVPGRTGVADPYNAPLAAVSANFNTVMLKRLKNQVVSAESQTPLTPTAKRLASAIGAKVERVNLINPDNAQRNFAELLQLKSSWKKVPVYLNQSLPHKARLIYRHENSKTLADVLRGALKYSNNFIANHVFLKLADAKPESWVTAEPVSFQSARYYAAAALSKQFQWSDFVLDEGSGLSRNNRFSAHQFVDLLGELRTHKTLLKEYKVSGSSATVHAKTGTLNDVHSYAGFIEFKNRHYIFVFNFNRKVAYRYREQLLKTLLTDLANN